MTANSIRGASRADASSLADVHIASWRAGYSHVIPAEVMATDEFESERRSWWEKWSFHPSQRVAVSVTDDEERIVGFAAYGPERERSNGFTGRGELYAFYFDPGAWGDGSAAALIDHVEERLGAEGFEQAVLWVLEDNPRARAFYERHGWTRSGITAEYDAYCDLTLPELEYHKHLTGGHT
jgi:GNAT superfamily N-acetyltransferase